MPNRRAVSAEEDVAERPEAWKGCRPSCEMGRLSNRGFVWVCSGMLLLVSMRVPGRAPGACSGTSRLANRSAFGGE